MLVKTCIFSNFQIFQCLFNSKFLIHFTQEFISLCWCLNSHSRHPRFWESFIVCLIFIKKVLRSFIIWGYNLSFLEKFLWSSCFYMWWHTKPTSFFNIPKLKTKIRILRKNWGAYYFFRNSQEIRLLCKNLAYKKIAKWYYFPFLW